MVATSLSAALRPARAPAPAALLLLVATALFVFVDRDPLGIRLWDESRNVVNALEMRVHGFSLVPRFAGQPDLWNTKPPLLIWLMAGSSWLFGPSEWALRLPSTIATLGTVLLVFAWTRRAAGLAPALLAAALLTLSPGFFGTHAARTADYDALLTLFTTAWLFAFHRALHVARPRARHLLPLALAGGLALLTKGIAGALPALGAAGYALAVGRADRLWNRPGYLLAALAAALPVVVLVAAQAWSTPGFAAAVFHNDLFDRFSQSLVGDPQPWWFYFGQLHAGLFCATALLPLAPLALLHGGLPPRARIALLFALSIAAGQLAVVTASASKLDHYVLPALPFLAIAAALGIASLATRLRRLATREPLLALGGAAVLTVVLTGVTRQAIEYRYRLLPREAANSEDGYRRLLLALDAADAGPVTIVDQGFVLEGKPHYAPVLRAYALLWALRGRPFAFHLGRSATFTPGGVASSCDVRWHDRLRRLGPELAGVPGCLAVRTD